MYNEALSVFTDVENVIALTTVIILFAFAFRLLFRISENTDDYVHEWMIRERKSTKSPINFEVSTSLIDGYKGYPQFYHYIISLFPEKLWVISGVVINITLDISMCFISALIIYFHTESYLAYLIGLSLLLFSPTLLPMTARVRCIGARVFGNFLFQLTVFLFYFLLNIDHGYWGIITVGLTYLIIITSQFALQAQIVFIFSQIFFLRDSLLILIPLLHIIFILSNLFIDIPGSSKALKHKIAHWKWYFRNFNTGVATTRKKSLIDILKLPVLLFKSPREFLQIIFVRSTIIITFTSAIPQLIVLYHFIDAPELFNDNLHQFLLTVNISMFFMCILTTFKHFIFLGEPERYHQYSIFTSVIQLLLLPALEVNYTFLVIVIIFQAFMSLANYIYSIFPELKSSLQFIHDQDLDDLISFVNTLSEKRIACIPVKIGYLISNRVTSNNKFYFNGINSTENGYLYQELDMGKYNFFHEDLSIIKNKYNLDILIVEKKSLDFARKNSINYRLEKLESLYKNAQYEVLKL